MVGQLKQESVLTYVTKGIHDKGEDQLSHNGNWGIDVSCTTDAKEDSYVVVTDIPSTFPHADMEGKVYTLQEAAFSELIVRLEPSVYVEYIWYNQKSKPMSYIPVKAIHGKLQEELLFWNIIIRHVTGVGL